MMTLTEMITRNWGRVEFLSIVVVSRSKTDYWLMPFGRILV
jgi:hypothetical protein